VQAVPIIYSPRVRSGQLSVWGRLFAGAIAIVCLTLLLLAVGLEPNPGGVGTHTQLQTNSWMPPNWVQSCNFLDRTGIPCPGCGMTTSFAWFARGNVIASFYVQPMGVFLALMCAAGLWIGLYLAITGKAAHRLLQMMPAGRYLMAILLLGVLGWGWKIFIHLKGVDGWG
jgi:hypothetical protein